MSIIVSACLAGEHCRFDGKNKLRQELFELVRAGKAIPICPEELGGLPTPRPPAEKVDDHFLTPDGTDVTAAYRAGAERALAIIQLLDAQTIYLKSKSPMCGPSHIYDGSHSKKLIEGEGVLKELLPPHLKVIEVP